MYLTRGGSVQRPLTRGPRGTLQPLTGRLHSETLQEVVTGYLKSKVSGDRTPWLAGDHLASYLLNQVGNPSLDPYKCPPTGGNQCTTLYL
jgi:hypothetical protein